MITSEIYLPNQIWTVGIVTTKSKLAQKTMTFIYTLSGLVLLLGTIIFGLVFALIRLGQARDALRKNEEKLIIRNQIANTFLTIPDNEMYGGVLDIVLDILESKYGVFGYIDNDGALVCPSMTKDIWDRCQITDKDIIFPEHTWGTSIWGNGLKTKKSAYANQPFNVPEGHIPVDRCLTVPLIYQNKSIGLISVANKSTDYTNSDKQTLEEIAEYVSPVLHARIERMHTENILDESKKRFKDVIDSINDLIMLLGPDFRIQLVNYAVSKAFNIPINEFTGQYCYKLLYGSNDICEGCPMIKALKSGKVTNALRYRPNGQIWDRMVYPVFDDNGNITGATVIGSDITKTKRSEEALRKSEEKYRTLLETTSEGCWMLNPKNKTIEVNESLCKMLGYSQDEMIGKTPFDFADHDNRKIFIEQTSKISTTSHRSYEITLKKKDGQDLHTYFNATTIRDESGEVQGSFAFVTDITQRNRAEDERNRLAVAIEQAAESVFITDMNGTIQYVNPAFERLTGYGRKEAIGKNPAMLKSGKHDALFYKKMRRTISRGNAWHGRIVNKKKDDSFYEADATISPVFDTSGKITNFVSIKRDITHEMELEKRLIQAQKMEAIGTLAGGIAHDFNNVLYSIIGYAELTMDDLPENSLAQNNLKELLIASNRAKDMVQQILTFSHQAETEKKPIKFQSVVKEAIKLLKTSIPTTIEICQNIDADCGPVLADPTQIHQVVMNLATNAYYAMREKGGVLNINVATEKIRIDDFVSSMDFNPGIYVKLSVTDTGHGMNKEIIEKIFDPYFTTKPPGQGTGMGLSTVHGIVKSHGGAIKVYSDPGKGTVFYVYFPMIEKKPDESKIVSAGTIQKGCERILLVDDQEQIVFMVKQTLERLGYKVAARTSSVDALEAFRAGSDRFDLVITDMTMPNMTGVELATKLLEIRPDIPIILCTGFSDLTDVNKAKAIGIREFLMKPIVKDQIASSIRKVLDS
jgi:PAS domain S-box-containing protein